MCCSVLSPEIVMHDDAYIGGRSENNIKCVVRDDLEWKNRTTRHILLHHWLCKWFSQFHRYPLCLPKKLISKHAPLKSEHEIYRPTRGLNPAPPADRSGRCALCLSPLSHRGRLVCLFVSRIMQNLLNQFSQNWVEWWHLWIPWKTY